ncbi:MFS transporter [Alsobacter soli]|uniref:MFS transporter n=1 Tax=Alsobacter soli TaxID=2109933 RepID=A0A2T1HRZ6_9HYPH|nr:MFS transporter [Alsobacter soli]PSC04289.1 MFS transporter [Alsobacter soli]
MDAATSPTPGSKIRAGTPAFRRATGAMFAAGFATFAALYCVQPLLPVFAQEFGLSPASSSLSLSVSTGILAVAMLGASFVSDIFGRKATMVAALAVSGVLTVALAGAGDWSQVLVLRALTGFALSGLPAVSIAYLADEMDRSAMGAAVGLTIAGNSIGGMGGRLLVSALADLWSWRVAIGVTGALCLVCALVFWRALPPSRHFTRVTPSLRGLLHAFGRHLADPGMLLLFTEGFLLMGGFVTLYNYVGFRLVAPPFGLSQTVVGFVFLVYVFGTISSALMGRLADRYGRRQALWASIGLMLAGLALTWPDNLPVLVLGIAVFTFGFFAAHSVASSWVGLRAEAARAQASSLYLLAYYMGSSVAGAVGGAFWSAAGWPGVAGMVAGLGVMALLVAVALARTPPPAWMR